MLLRRVTVLQARQFLLQRLGLSEPFADVVGAIDSLAYVQMDPINVCGRMHDLILRNRIGDYRRR